MSWGVSYHEDYLAELKKEDVVVQDAVFATAEVLKHSGPMMGRLYADTLKGSRYPNMKELRVTLPDGEWRIAYAFDPTREAVLLVGGSKSGTSSGKFYERLIRTADRRYEDHLAGVKKER